MSHYVQANSLSKDEVLEQAETLSLPSSVVEYFQGYLGIPEGGFPEPLRTRVLANKPVLPNGRSCFEGRPGAEMPDYDFDAATEDLEAKWTDIDHREVLSHVMYPAVYEDYKAARASCALADTQFQSITVLPVPSSWNAWCFA
jgi:pyruvate carboxylase